MQKDTSNSIVSERISVSDLLLGPMRVNFLQFFTIFNVGCLVLPFPSLYIPYLLLTELSIDVSN